MVAPERSRRPVDIRPTIRPPGWRDAPHASCRPLLTQEPESPWVAYTWHAGGREALIPRGASLERLEKQSQIFLASALPPIRSRSGLFFLRHPLAAELLLSPAFRTRIRDHWCGPVLVAAPIRGQIAAAALGDRDAVAALVAWSREQYLGTRAYRVAPRPFLVSGGRLLPRFFEAERAAANVPAQGLRSRRSTPSKRPQKSQYPPLLTQSCTQVLRPQLFEAPG